VREVACPLGGVCGKLETASALRANAPSGASDPDPSPPPPSSSSSSNLPRCLLLSLVDADTACCCLSLLSDTVGRLLPRLLLSAQGLRSNVGTPFEHAVG